MISTLPHPKGVNCLFRWATGQGVGRGVGSPRRERKGDRGGPLLSSPLPSPSAPSPEPPGKSLFAWYLHFICIAFN